MPCLKCNVNILNESRYANCEEILRNFNSNEMQSSTLNQISLNTYYSIHRKYSSSQFFGANENTI